MSLPLGTQLGNYKIIALIGAGGMGEVYRAHDDRLGRDVAIKVLPESFAEDKERLRRFEQEARAAGALNHPNIVAVHDLGSHEGSPCLVMELLEGETLRARMGGRPMPARKAVEIALQVAQGLAAAHEKGIVHRDLKPENIFLTKAVQVKILDFGLAKQQLGPIGQGDETLSLESAAGTVVGTTGYMSPEQVQGQALDGRSDLFSLGVVLRELLSGKNPFQGASALDTLHAILRQEPRPLDAALEVPPAVERILDFCLAKEPSARFHSAHDLAIALGSLSGSNAAQPRPSTPAGRWKRTAVRYGPLVFAVLCLGLWLHQRALSGHPKVATFRRLTVHEGQILTARFATDGRSVLFAAQWLEQPIQVYRDPLDTLEELPTGPTGANLLGQSRQGEVALGLDFNPFPPNESLFYAGIGVLAQAPHLEGGLHPKEMLQGALCADFGPDGRMAVARVVKGRSLLEYPIGTVRAETPGWYGHLRVAPDGRSLAFIEYPVLGDDAGRPARLDLPSGRVSYLAPSYPTIYGLAWHGNEVWFTAGTPATGRTLYGSGPHGGLRGILNGPGIFHLHDIAADGRILMARDDLRSGVLAVTDDQEKPRDLSRGYWCALADLSADGSTVLISPQDDNTEYDYSFYISRVDGTAATFIGKGILAALSPDQARVALVVPKPSPHLVILPTGAGEPREVPDLGLSAYQGLAWTPDGKLLVCASKGNAGRRIHLLDPASAATGASWPEGLELLAMQKNHVAPDGSRFVAWSGKLPLICSLALPGEAPRALQGLKPGERPIGWCADSRHLYVASRALVSSGIWRLDPITGHREPWTKVPLQTSPGSMIPKTLLSLDGRHMVHQWTQWRSTLFLVEGLE